MSLAALSQTAATFLRSTPGGGGFLDELLVAALHGAVALEEVDGVAVLVAQDLDLDVAGVLEELLDEDAAVAEGGLGFLLGLLDVGAQGRLVVADAHAPAAPAGGGLG
ncbi:MAG: hypothetical protein KatS3mg103_1236 [Phycisphaerales bacterium]|nr:MAG: hypothetical protein KatS3mg103_1236 [Phycisphaerales bacterium]